MENFQELDASFSRAMTQSVKDSGKPAIEALSFIPMRTVKEKGR